MTDDQQLPEDDTTPRDESAGESTRIRVQLRPLDLTDLDAIQPLFMELNATQAQSDPLVELTGEPTFIAWMCKRLRHERMLDQNYVAAVAEREDGVILGYCSGYVEFSGSLFRVSQHGVISELYLDPVVRGVGLGSQLIHYVMRGLAQCGVQHVAIEVPPEAASEEGFFAQHGFRPSSVTMVCDLRAQASEEDV